MSVLKDRILRKLWHLALAIPAGLCTVLLVQWSVWVNMRDNPSVCHKQGLTRGILRMAVRELDEFQLKNHQYPEKTEEILGYQQAPMRYEDGWGRPLIYQRMSPDEYLLYSLGRDGQIGGLGFDADLYHDRREGTASRPTIREFFTTPDEVRNTFWMVSFMAGLMTIHALTFDPYFGFPAERLGRKGVAACVLGIIIGSLIIGTLLLPLHIPSGH